MTGRSVLHALAVSALLLNNGALPAAQSGDAGTAAAAAALALGRYDEVERLLASATDPQSVALRARADVERGRYPEALSRLAPVASSAPTSDAALELGLLQLYLGRLDDGTRTLNRLLTAQARNGRDFLRMARAAHALGDANQANDLYRQANRALPDDPEVNAAWGTLFLEKGELGDAKQSFEITLNKQPSHPVALLGMARVAGETNGPAAEKALEALLAANPAYVPALLLQAERALDDRKREIARGSVDAALKVNPNSLEARALDAAMAALEDRPEEFERKARAVLEINPRYGEVYRVVGDQLARNYRFEEAMPITRRALELDPGNMQAYQDLGLQLLRLGDEPGARKALETKFNGDRFQSSLVTKNLLEMLDKVDTFETVRDGDLVMRFAPEEAAVMKEQAPALAREALDALSRRWNFTPKGPILIEMFPVHDDFAVRTLGLPGMIGALGVCFGKVVALDSPHARPPGEYNWQPTLWHELAHVVTLQLSNNRLPRWLSEGISQWEERRARPEWGWEQEISYAHAMDTGKILKLADLNEGFSDPQFISNAYYEASLVVEHLSARFGDAALRSLVQSYSRGIDDEQAFREVFGQSLEQIQVSFDAAMETRFAPVRAALKRPEIDGEPSVEQFRRLAAEHPGSFAIQMGLGMALEKANDLGGAITAFEKAAALLPRMNGEDNPNKHIAAAALKKGDKARAITALQAVMKVDHDDVASGRQLAALLAETADAAQTEDAYRRVVAVDPFDASAQAGLGRLALKRNDTSTALRAFRSALAANPADRASAHLDLADAYLATGRVAEARTETFAALEIAPGFERVQSMLVKIEDAARK